MQFNSYNFILYFIPICLLLYYILGHINKTLSKIVLIFGSFFVYGFYGLDTLLILFLSLVFNFTFLIIIQKKELKKSFMAVPIVLNIFLLFYFKYLNFSIENINMIFGTAFKLQTIILPVGISFFTFQQIAYIVAISRKEIQSLNLIDYFAYILFFPKLIMGPLMDPIDFQNQINDKNSTKLNINNIAYGVKIFSFGLLKKVLLADTFFKAVEWGFSNLGTTSSMDMILLALFYTFEIYFDFSGYSDMAVGSALMFNIKLPINFDSPYKAISIRDFWKRWHISLTKFFTKYIYIPLGGNKKGELFTCVNTMIVFLISGIWHGANWTFILWGILHGLFSVIDRIIEKKNINIFEPARWLMTFIVVNILWLLFRSDSVQQWLSILIHIFSFENTSISSGLLNNFVLPETTFLCTFVPFIRVINEHIRGFMMLVFIFISFIICFLPENNYRKIDKLTTTNMLFSALCMIWGITCLSSESVFVYFNF